MVRIFGIEPKIGITLEPVGIFRSFLCPNDLLFDPLQTLFHVLVAKITRFSIKPFRHKNSACCRHLNPTLAQDYRVEYNIFERKYYL